MNSLWSVAEQLVVETFHIESIPTLPKKIVDHFFDLGNSTYSAKGLWITVDTGVLQTFCQLLHCCWVLSGNLTGDIVWEVTQRGAMTVIMVSLKIISPINEITKITPKIN